MTWCKQGTVLTSGTFSPLSDLGVRQTTAKVTVYFIIYLHINAVALFPKFSLCVHSLRVLVSGEVLSVKGTHGGCV